MTEAKSTLYHPGISEVQRQINVIWMHVTSALF